MSLVSNTTKQGSLSHELKDSNDERPKLTLGSNGVMEWFSMVVIRCWRAPLQRSTGPKNSACFGRRFRSVAFLLGLLVPTTANAWWNGDWSIRKKITIDTSATGTVINQPIGSAAVLLRLHDGNFQFASAKDDGADIRFVAADDKTLLPYHIEKYDSLLNEAFVWVKIPEVAPGGKTILWLYYGNNGNSVTRVDNSKATYDPETVLVYHFNGEPPVDVTSYENNGKTAAI
jgi:biopolymer transport protein ExbB